MSSKNFDEMVKVLGWVARVNRAITRPVIEKKVGLKIASEGANLGEIVTHVDIGISRALLDGAAELGIPGLRSLYPGSFSEEQDSPDRQTALAIYEVDPLDGTGDFKKTYNTSSVMPPTTLVAKIERDTLDQCYGVHAGMIFETVNEYALVSDGARTGLYAVEVDGSIREVQFSIIEPKPWRRGDVASINRRSAYPQRVFDEIFPKFLEAKGIRTISTLAGGAGMQALQFFRNYIHPEERAVPAFTNLSPLTLVFNCQPDWKTWDTDPTVAIARAFDVRVRTDIFGSTLTADAKAPMPKDMWHRRGCVFSTSGVLAELMYRAAREFHVPDDSERDLLSINY